MTWDNVPSRSAGTANYRWLMASMGGRADQPRVHGIFPMPISRTESSGRRTTFPYSPGAKILVTGGTGFLGSWLVASLLVAAEPMVLGIDLTGADPNPLLWITPRRIRSAPSSPWCVATFGRLPEIGRFDYIVHGAASSSTAQGAD